MISKNNIRKSMWVSLLVLGTFLSVPATAFAGTQSSASSSSIPSTSTSLSLYASPINLSNYKTYKVIGIGNAGSTINITISDASGGSIERTTIAESNGSWSIANMDVSPLTDGSIKITAGEDTTNGSVNITSFSTSKNTTAPVAPNVCFSQVENA